MRIWTIHPGYLDPRGLVALWREALLAQKVLQGGTRGYRAHPQLARFRAERDPVACLASYLAVVWEEAEARGYRFDGSKIAAARTVAPLVETDGQLDYEWEHLKRKLRVRHPEQYARVAVEARPRPHPLFQIVSGGVRDWERVRPGDELT